VLQSTILLVADDNLYVLHSCGHRDGSEILAASHHILALASKLMPCVCDAYGNSIYTPTAFTQGRIIQQHLRTTAIRVEQPEQHATDVRRWVETGCPMLTMVCRSCKRYGDQYNQVLAAIPMLWRVPSCWGFTSFWCLASTQICYAYVALDDGGICV
jgi:hypothetical protein